MLTIAQCTDSFLPIADGAGRISYTYARALADRGHEVYVVTPMVNGYYRGRHPFEILDYVSIKRPGSQRGQIGMANLDLHYLARADALRFDVVHTHSPGSAGMEAARLASRLHVPLVGSFHPQYFEEYLLSQDDPRAASLAVHFIFDYFNRCDEIWTVGEDAKNLLLAQGFTGHIEIMENGTQRYGLEAAGDAAVRERFHLGPEPILLYVGRLERVRNVFPLIDVAGTLHASKQPFQMLFVGHGADEEALKSSAVERGLGGCVRFLGHIDDERLLHGLYAAATLCLFPGNAVGPGLVVREAAAQGTPSLVAAGSTAASYLRDGENGLVCAPEAGEMAKRVSAFLRDTDGMHSISASARKTVPIGWDAVIDRVESRYEALARRDRALLTRKVGIFRRELEQVDQSLNKRTLDLMWKFLTQDHQHLYTYPHHPEKPRALPAPDALPLPRSTPEAQGVSSRDVLQLIDAINADPAAGAQAVTVLRHGHVIAEASWTPYELTLPHELYSLSKSVTSTAIGMLYDEGLLSLDEKLSDLFPDKMPEDETHPSHQLRIRHLLNMSTGSTFNEIGSGLGADWEKEFLQAPVKFAAGTRFEYNSMNTYMLSAIVTKKTGLSMTAYLTPRLFEPLGVAPHHWETSPTGCEKGGWGLLLTPESVAKIGQLYLNRGLWTVDGAQKRLLSETWIDAATRPQIETPDGEITYGYGHQIWMTARPGAFLFNGAFGQYMLAMPDLDMLVVLFSGTARLFAQGGVLDAVDKAFERVSDHPLPDDPAAENALAVTQRSLSVSYRAAFYNPTWSGPSFTALCRRLDGHVYSFPANVASLFPVSLMSVHNNFSSGVQRIAFRAQDSGLSVEFVEGDAHHRLDLVPSGYAAGEVVMRGDVYAVRTDLQTLQSEDGTWRLRLNVHFIETPYTRLIEMKFSEGAVSVCFDENPSLQDSSVMLMQLSGMTRADVFRYLLPMLRQERMQNRLRTFTTVTVEGKL